MMSAESNRNLFIVLNACWNSLIDYGLFRAKDLSNPVSELYRAGSLSLPYVLKGVYKYISLV